MVKMSDKAKLKNREAQEKWKKKNPNWRKEYRKLPHVKAAEKEYRNRPEVKEMRRKGRLEYVKDPKVHKKLIETSRAYYRDNKPQQLEHCKRRHREIRQKVLDHYGNKCKCCGEDTYEFMTIDHINDDGHKRRKEEKTGSAFYRWIIKNNYPKDLQLLCWNCNLAKARYGKCPHKKD